MDAAHSHESATRDLIASAEELDPNSPEFYDACQALIKQSAGRRLAARASGGEPIDVQRSPTASRQARTSDQPRDTTHAATEAATEALRESQLREDQARAHVQLLQAELANVTTRHDEALATLAEASERADQLRTDFAHAMEAISERDTAINELQQVIAGQDREINDLQRRLIEAEEARIADASAILDSLDKYRV